MRMSIPSDAFCMACITLCDLYPRDSWNFVFGLANITGRCGVYSLARYLPNFGEHENTRLEVTSDDLPLIIQRACKTMCHEIGHMFGILHCIYFNCLMNGSNHLDESDSRKPFLCPVCLRKLHLVCQFRILERYEKMERFWNEFGVKTNCDWLQRRIRCIHVEEPMSH